jgi:hypothetical protein
MHRLHLKTLKRNLLRKTSWQKYQARNKAKIIYQPMLDLRDTKKIRKLIHYLGKW